MQPIIEINHLSKKYRIGNNQPYITLRDTISDIFSTKTKQDKNDFWALKDVSFQVVPGEIVGVIGRNGAGKSTLLKILSRITYPTSGEVRLRGKISSLLEVGTGFSPELTGRENIFLNGSILGMTRREINKKLDEIISFAEIEKFLDTPVKYYSSGMYTRLAFSVAAHLEPDILLVDEVLAVGDTEFQKKSLGKMEEVKAKEGRTILFVSHNMKMIEQLCSRCVLLDKGSVRIIGPTRDVVKKYLQMSSDLMGVNLIHRTDRSGNGKLKVTSVEFVQNGKLVNELVTGVDTVIRVHYRVNEQIKNSVNFAIGINEASLQTRLLFLSSSVLGKNIKVPSKEKSGVIEVNIKKLPLSVGSFSYDVWFDCQRDILDWVVEAGRFEVLFGDFYSSGVLPNQNQGSVLAEYEINQQ